MGIPGKKGAKNLDDHLMTPVEFQRASGAEWQAEYMVYTFEMGRGNEDLSLINKNLQVSKQSSGVEPPMSLTYYSELTPGQRADFYKWLRSKRKYVAHQEYMLLWLCHVERRIFEDGDDLNSLQSELMRLYFLTIDHPHAEYLESFLKRSASLLWFSYARFGGTVKPEAVYIFCELLEGRVDSAMKRRRLLSYLASKSFSWERLFTPSEKALAYNPINKFLKPEKANVVSLRDMQDVYCEIWKRANRVAAYSRS